MIDLSKAKRVLAFFAHPDDETLVAGATISKLSRLGVEVHVAIPATGVHARSNVQDRASRDSDLERLRKNCMEAMKILGVPPERIHLGNFPDNQIDRHTLLELIHWLEARIREIKPDVLLTHHRFCTNVDHQYCHEAAVVATRPSAERRIHLVCGETPSSTGYLRPAQWEPNLYTDVTEQDIKNKIGSMEAYKTEARPYPHPRSGEILKALAMVRGSESGFNFAEAFMVQRAFG